MATTDIASKFLPFAVELAQASGDFIKPHFGRRGLTVDLKSDATPVTIADRGAEELMRAMIAKRFPDHGVLGEEYGAERQDAEFVWVLDPVDGTKAFTTACPLFGTLIGLMHQGEPCLGLISNPILGQLMIGNGTKTTLNGAPVRCRTTTQVEDATLLYSDHYAAERYQDGAAFDTLARKVKLARTWGDCYGYLLMAAGWADIALDPIVNPWDIAAIIPIVRGSGGIITDWHGDSPSSTPSAVACATATLHASVIDILNP
jgi:histidinol phosphatase-like enzyme (inositol monophosphatase family)